MQLEFYMFFTAVHSGFTYLCVEGIGFLTVPEKAAILSPLVVSLCYQLYKMQAIEKLGY